MDEAINALDTNNKDEIFKCLTELKNRQKTIIIISHDQDVLERCDLTYKLRDKKLIKIK